MAFYGCGVLVFGACLVIVLASTSDHLSSRQDWSQDCPAVCRCKWVSGKKAAECTYGGLTAPPNGLSPDIQSLNLTGNSFHKLPNSTFKSINIVNLHKIYLRECGIQDLHKDAFRGLELVIEIDLTDNKIHSLHPGTFRDNFRLRILYLNKNPIQKLEEGLFTNLTFLQTIDISECELSHISYKTFNNVPNLQILSLNGNNLTRMKLSVIENLLKLRSLVLHNNPWHCDCHMKAFRDWVMEKNLYAKPTSCVEPLKLQGKLWSDIPSDEFACKPQIIWPPPGTALTPTGGEFTLGCRVTGNPLPGVDWVFNSHIIANNTRSTYGDVRYTIRTGGESTRWVNLTIVRLRPADRGVYKCVAKSSGGLDERNITVIVPTSADGFVITGSANDSWSLILGLIIGMVALLILVTVFCCCFCCKRRKQQSEKTPGNGHSPNGDISHHISASSEQEKSLLTVVNPVQKPPRRYESQAPSTGGTEMSELNKKLLDDGSMYIAPNGDIEEDQSVDSKDTPQLSRDKLDGETFPPDLIAFQGRGPSISPAGSSASTALENSRMQPLVGPQSPVQSPIYHGFGTLPYSRSQSPFSPVAPVLQRQGYVTIPRRHRVPSWSSAPTPTLLEEAHLPLRAEPVYDNLGPRTTADGSSVLSLNKVDTPIYDSPRTVNFASSPFEESNSGILRPLPSPLSPVDRRPWSSRSMDGGSLKRVGSADGPLGPTTSTPRAKVAPKPPPKPKKNVPLYEDEGEDGTEV